jgi:hypothetical protein
MLLALMMALAAETAPPTKPDNVARSRELICAYEQINGSRFRKKICRTREEVEMRRMDDQQRVRLNQRLFGSKP